MIKNGNKRIAGSGARIIFTRAPDGSLDWYRSPIPNRDLKRIMSDVEVIDRDLRGLHGDRYPKQCASLIRRALLEQSIAAISRLSNLLRDLVEQRHSDYELPLLFDLLKGEENRRPRKRQGEKRKAEIASHHHLCLQVASLMLNVCRIKRVAPPPALAGLIQDIAFPDALPAGAPANIEAQIVALLYMGMFQIGEHPSGPQIAAIRVFAGVAKDQNVYSWLADPNFIKSLRQLRRDFPVELATLRRLLESDQASATSE